MINQISKDILTASKEGNSLKRDLLRLLKGTLDQSMQIPSDEDVRATIKKMIKSNSITMDSMLETSPRESWSDDWKDFFQKLTVENEILANYLPKELSETEIESILSGIDLKSSKSAGQAVGMAMKTIKSKNLSANPDLVKVVVERLMSK